MDRGANNEIPTAQILEHWILIDLFVSPVKPLFTQVKYREYFYLFPGCFPSWCSSGLKLAVFPGESLTGRLFQGFVFPLMFSPLILPLQHRQQFPTFLQLLEDRNAAITDFLGLSIRKYSLAAGNASLEVPLGQHWGLQSISILVWGYLVKKDKLKWKTTPWELMLVSLELQTHSRHPQKFLSKGGKVTHGWILCLPPIKPNKEIKYPGDSEQEVLAQLTLGTEIQITGLGSA